MQIYYSCSVLLLVFLLLLKDVRHSFYNSLNNFIQEAKVSPSDYKGTAFLFITSFLLIGFYARIGVEFHHDGIMYKTALDVFEGKVLFKETFSQYGFLTHYFQAFAMFFFGKTLFAIKFMTVLFYSLSISIFHLCATKIFEKKLVFIMGLLWIILGPWMTIGPTFYTWSSIFAIPFQGLVLLNLLNYFETKKYHYLVLCGFFGAFIFLCRQPVGFLAFLSMAATGITLVFLKEKTIKDILKDALFITLGALPVLLFFFGWLVINSAATDWYLQTVLYPATWARSHGIKDPSFLNLVFINIWETIKTFFGLRKDFMGGLIWAFFPIVIFYSCLSLGILTFKGKFTSPHSKLNLKFFLAIGFTCLYSWFQYYPSPDAAHCFWSMTPAFALFGFFIHSLVMNRDLILNKLIIATITLAMGTSLTMNISSGVKKFGSSFDLANGSEGPSTYKGMKINKKLAPCHREFQEKMNFFLGQSKSRVVVNLTADALPLALGNNVGNIHPLFVNWNYLLKAYPNYIDEIEKRVKLLKPLVITGEPSAILVEGGYPKEEYEKVFSCWGYAINMPLKESP